MSYLSFVRKFEIDSSQKQISLPYSSVKMSVFSYPVFVDHVLTICHTFHVQSDKKILNVPFATQKLASKPFNVIFKYLTYV